MKLQKHLILSLGMAALAVGITTSRAAANEIYKGTFNLPVEAYWSSNLLPAGDYSISMDTDSARNSLVHLRGADFQAVILAGAVSLHNTSPQSRLKLEEVNGVYVVRELDAGVLGKDYRFGVSKVVRRQTDRATNREPLNIPVAAGGGF